MVYTVLTDDKGASIRITDFAPRFREYDRIFRPPQLMGIIEPVADQAWNEKRGAFTAAIGIDDLGASVAARDRVRGNPRSPLRANRGSDRT
jgi:hypothetical protein